MYVSIGKEERYMIYVTAKMDIPAVSDPPGLTRPIVSGTIFEAIYLSN